MRAKSYAIILCFALLPVAACSGDDAPPPDMGVDLEVKPDLPPDTPFGRACDNLGGLCKEQVNGRNLFCIATQAGASTGRGYCALECQLPAGQACYGTPNATLAKCLVQGAAAVDGGTAPMYCAFVCESNGRTYTCPPTQECNPDKGQGDRLCIPRTK